MKEACPVGKRKGISLEVNEKRRGGDGAS